MGCNASREDGNKVDIDSEFFVKPIMGSPTKVSSSYVFKY